MSYTKRVLIAEDSSVIQNLARKILEFQHYEITSVKNGEQVLQLLEKEDFDIILPVPKKVIFMQSIPSNAPPLPPNGQS